MPRRLEQVNAFLQERIGNFLLSQFETPPGVLVTITHVSTSPDLHSAKIYVSILPENDRGSTLECLRKIVPELRRSLYHDLKTHTVPQLNFIVDDTEARAAQIEHLIDTLDSK